MTQHLIPIGMTKHEGVRAILGNISRTTVYELINSGELVHVNIGRRGFVTAASIDAYIERLTGQAPGAA